MAQLRPTCVNHGCNGKVSVMEGKISDPNPRWRVHCGHCQAASYGKWPHQPWVTPFKKGMCSNLDNHLGFPCVIDWKLVASAGLRVSTQIDHKNGDPADNRLENLQELCPTCHSEKGKRNGDFNGHR